MLSFDCIVAENVGSPDVACKRKADISDQTVLRFQFCKQKCQQMDMSIFWVASKSCTHDFRPEFVKNLRMKRLHGIATQQIFMSCHWQICRFAFVIVTQLAAVERFQFTGFLQHQPTGVEVFFSMSLSDAIRSSDQWHIFLITH